MSKEHKLPNVKGERGFSGRQRDAAHAQGIRIRRLGKPKGPDFEPKGREPKRPSVIVFVRVVPVDDSRYEVGYDVVMCYRAFRGGKLRFSRDVACAVESVIGGRRPTGRYYLLGGGRRAFKHAVQAVAKPKRRRHH